MAPYLKLCRILDRRLGVVSIVDSSLSADLPELYVGILHFYATHHRYPPHRLLPRQEAEVRCSCAL